jgi:hypothetical protein
MLKRLGAFSVLTLVALAATTAVPAAADAALSIDGAKQAIRSAVRGDFEGGIAKGTLRLDPCTRDGSAVRCQIDLEDQRGHVWCGRGSAWPGEAAYGKSRTVTRFHLHRFRCGS